MPATVTVYRRHKFGEHQLAYITYEPATRTATRYTFDGQVIDVSVWNTNFNDWFREYSGAWTKDINQSVLRDFIDVGL